MVTFLSDFTKRAVEKTMKMRKTRAKIADVDIKKIPWGRANAGAAKWNFAQNNKVADGHLVLYVSISDSDEREIADHGISEELTIEWAEIDAGVVPKNRIDKNSADKLPWDEDEIKTVYLKRVKTLDTQYEKDFESDRVLNSLNDEVDRERRQANNLLNNPNILTRAQDLRAVRKHENNAEDLISQIEKRKRDLRNKHADARDELREVIREEQNTRIKFQDDLLEDLKQEVKIEMKNELANSYFSQKSQGRGYMPPFKITSYQFV